MVIEFDMTRAGTDRVKSNRCHVRSSLHGSGTRFHDARSGRRGDWFTQTLGLFLAFSQGIFGVGMPCPSIGNAFFIPLLDLISTKPMDWLRAFACRKPRVGQDRIRRWRWHTSEPGSPKAWSPTLRNVWRLPQVGKRAATPL